MSVAHGVAFESHPDGVGRGEIERHQRRAAQLLSCGGSFPCREALEAVQRAQEAARDGVRPSEPEDLQRAAELAAEQTDIQKELLELATRNEERKGSKPMPSQGVPTPESATFIGKA